MCNIAEIGCGIHSDCPLQKACINALCVDPCAHSVCGNGQECHVDNHQAVCIQCKCRNS